MTARKKATGGKGRAEKGAKATRAESKQGTAGASTGGTRKTAAKKGARKATKTARGGTKAPKKSRRRRRADPAHGARIAEILAAHDPDPQCALDHANPYELTAATILSAQCTDVRVNMVTPALFARYPTPQDLADAKQEDVEELVQSTGFYRNKAKNLIGMGKRVVEAYGGEIPQDMDELLTLPGVARKTANVVRGVCFGLADGVVVDTHVKRISNRLGLTEETDPVKIERDLMDVIPREHWIQFSHRVIRLGRTICPARKPNCEACPLTDVCPKVGV